MRRSFMLSAVVLAAASGWAGWEADLHPSLYSVTFADYAEGEALSDKGAQGGSWGSPSTPVGTMVFAKKIDGRPVMSYITSTDFTSSSDAKRGLVLTPSQFGMNGGKAVRVRMWASAFEVLPNLSKTSDKFAFAISALEGEEPSFVGWSKTGWQKLRLASGKVKPVSGAWYDVSVWIAHSLNDKVQVQYRLKVGEDEYEPLLAPDGTVWVDAGGSTGSDEVIREVEIRGEGAFDDLAGKELPTPGISVHFK